MSLADEFLCEKFRLEHPQPTDFCVCYFQRTRLVHLGWVLYRFFLCFYFMTTLIYYVASWTHSRKDEEDNFKFLLYFGVWAYGIQLEAYASGFLCALLEYMRPGRTSSSGKLPFYVKYFWFFYTASIPLALISTFSYLIGIRDRVYFPLNAGNGLLYIPNIILSAIDLLLIAFPIRFLHFYAPDVVVCVYIIVTAIYETAGGHGADGQKTLYKYLRWNDEPYKTAFWVGVITFVGFLEFFIVCLKSYYSLRRRSKHMGDE